MFTTKLQVTKSQITGSAYGHVHHADSLRFLEAARLRMLEELGFPNESFLEQGLFTVVSALQVRYLRELFEGEITVTCGGGRVEGKRLSLEQTILNGKGKRAIEAVVELQFLSRSLGRAVPVPEAFLNALQRYFEAAAS